MTSEKTISEREVELIHDALPELSLDDIDTSVTILRGSEPRSNSGAWPSLRWPLRR
jgi:hypothetical protein